MRRSVINQREITEDGTIQVRIGKQIVEDSKVIHEAWHRASFPPGSNAAQTMSLVDDHLTSMGYGAVPTEGWGKVHATIAAEHTPEVIAAYETKQLQLAEARRKQQEELGG